MWCSAFIRMKVFYNRIHIISDKTFLVNNKKERMFVKEHNSENSWNFYVISTVTWCRRPSQAQTSKSQHTSKCYKMLYYKIVNNASAKCCAEPLCVIVFYCKKKMYSGLHSAWFTLKVTATLSIWIQRGITDNTTSPCTNYIKDQETGSAAYFFHKAHLMVLDTWRYICGKYLPTFQSKSQ